MRYHDFHLRGYSVEDFGSRIVLDLVFDSPDRKTEESRIEFRDVVCYSFEHSAGAIITDINEVNVSALAREEEPKLAHFAKHGLEHWRTDISDDIATLERERLRGWRIESAIGFSGFIIAGSVEASA